MRTAIICGAMALTVTAASTAEKTSGNYWLPHCKLVESPRLTAEYAYCLGTLDGLTFFSREAGICPPEEGTMAQAVRVVVRYMEARPERLHEPFRQLAVDAMRAAWPCK
jgi:Rap1a immunity proteins